MTAATHADVYPMKCQRPEVPSTQPLLEMLIMVKNAGPAFRDMLENNLPWVDSWAVLDTGSTDGVTLNIIQELRESPKYAHKPSFLFQEPFINFRDSRNRLLELRAGSDCFFQIILDDSYYLENGDGLRAFLDLVRYEVEPVVSDSFSLFIKSADMAYLSNRIIKTKGVPSRNPPAKPLRYDPRFRIHEIIQPNKTFSLPEKFGYIRDVASDYMVDRTKQRKDADLEMLYADLEALPGSLRVMYYLAETYLCQQNYEEAVKWYEKRANSPNPYAEADDYDEERYDAKYKLAVLSYIYMKLPWEGTCLELFLAAYTYMPKRPEAMFMIGYHYHSVGSMELAYTFLKTAFEIGPPSAHGMNLILEQYYFHAPRLLAPLCLLHRNYQVGEKAILRMIDYYRQTNHATPFPVTHLNRFLKIFQLMNAVHPPLSEIATQFLKKHQKNPQTRFIVFVTSCGWKPFHGKTLRQNGLGGSETCIIQLAEHIAKLGSTSVSAYQPIIFCPCDAPSTEYRGVWYENITAYPAFLRLLVDEAFEDANQRHRVFLQRTTEYMWMTSELKIPFYLQLHDVLPDQEVLVGHTGKDSTFRGVICLSEFHRGLFLEQFPHMSSQVHVLGYGIPDYAVTGASSPNTTKLPHSFIFPSFPNRGLLVLLRDLWGRILEQFPDARLFLFCDFENAWLREVAGAEIEEIQQLLLRYGTSVKNLGWQSPHILQSFWQKAEYWVYPCTFAETFCLTALEAQFFGCKAITCDLGALPETGRYGAVIIPGDPRERTWQDQVMQALMVVTPETPVTSAPAPAPTTPTIPTFADTITPEFIRRFCDPPNI